MPQCPRCGKEVPSEANYCPSCGAKLKVDVDLIHEEIAEARHEELVGYAIAGLGIAFMILSAVLMSIEERRYDWTGSSPVEVVRRPFLGLAFALVILGVLIMSAGFVIGLYHYYKRLKLMRQLKGK